MKIRILNFLIRLGRVFIFWPVAFGWMILGLILWVPYYIITGEDIYLSKADDVVQAISDFFEEIYEG